MNKRHVSAILVIIMLITMMPASVFAVATPSGVSATKSILPGDYNAATGEATITLTVTGQDQVNTTGADVIVVVDESGSMKSVVSDKKVTCGCTSWYKETHGFIFKYTDFHCHDCGEWIKDGPNPPASDWSCSHKVKTTRMIVAKNATKEFATSFLANKQNKMALIGFSSEDYSNHLTHVSNFTSSESDLHNIINKMYWAGGTNYTNALNKAIEYANNRSDKTRPLYVVMMSDGLPGTNDGNGVNSTAWNGTVQASTLKTTHKATIYTVGIGLSGTANALSILSSNGEDGKPLYSNVGTTNMDTDLAAILDAIKGRITTVHAGTNAVMTDVINSAKFDYAGVVAGTGITTTVSGGNTVVTWNIGNITGTKTAKIKVILKKDYRETGQTYKTNNDVYLKYTDAAGTPNVLIPKSQIGDPVVTTTAKTFKVSYGYVGPKPASAPAAPATVDVRVGDTYTIDTTLEAGDIFNGYSFGGWYIDNNNGSDKVVITNGQFVMPAKAVNLKGQWTAVTYTVNYTTDGNGTITGEVSQTVNHGDGTSSVTAEPNTGYHFVQWSDGLETPTRTDANVTANATYTAQFALNQYTVAYTTDGNGTITGNASQTVNYNGSTTAVTAVPNTGYHFVQWSDEKTNATRSDNNVKSNAIYTAQFKINEYTVAYVTDGNGTITGEESQTVNYDGSTTSVTAEPNTGYHFVKWSDGKTEATRSDSNVKGNATYTAEFALNQYTVAYTTDGNGTITGTASQTVNHGDGTSSVTAEPNTGYHFVQWSDGVDTPTRTDANVTANATYTAEFALNQYTVAYTTDGNGTITGTASQTVNHGDGTSSVTAEPNTGYHFVQWSDGVETPTRTDANVTANATYTAEFELNQYTVAYTTDGNGTITGTASQTVNYDGNTTSVTAVPNAGYHFLEWSDGVTSPTRMDVNVKDSAAYTAVFEKDVVMDITDYSGVYDGKTHSITINNNLEEEMYLMYSSDGEDWDPMNPEYSEVIGSPYTVFVGLYNGNEQLVGSGKGTITINQRPITITAASASKRYDGTPLTRDAYTYTLEITDEGLLESLGHQLQNVTVTGSQTSVGSGDNMVTGGSIVAPDVNPQPVLMAVEGTETVDVTANYAIKYVNGTLTVTRRNSSNRNNNTTIEDEEVPLGPLNMVDHFAYIQGYPDNTVRPQGNVTREEVAAVFFRLLDPSYRETIRAANEDYNDVAESRWSVKHIGTLSNGQIFTGYQDGTFKPGSYMTKAELAAVASRFDNLSTPGAITFSDVAGHWAEKYILSAAEKGWVTGYGDGTFKPDQYITRAELVTLVNKVLGRKVKTEGILPDALRFTDLEKGKWYYEAMMEATNSHLFDRNEDSYETWTEIYFPVNEM